jgi:hypothetical protein
MASTKFKHLMQRILLLIFIVFSVTFSSCDFINKKGIKGNGHVVTETRNISAFNKLRISGVFDVIIEQGESQKLVIETDENILPLIKSNVKDSVLLLTLSEDSSYYNSTKLTIHVTIKNIEQLDVVGVNGVKSVPLQLHEFVLHNKGVGNTNLNLSCHHFQAKLDGVGNVTLTGNADSAAIVNSGVGNLYANQFITQQLKIINSGVGNAEVNAQQQINISNTGIGNINYTGNAKVNMVKDDGIGKVIKD